MTGIGMSFSKLDPLYEPTPPSYLLVVSDYNINLELTSGLFMTIFCIN
jgi:hypothetical protein